jgi:hypothetical protein
MKVSELIEGLSKLDPNLEVFVRGYEGGYDDVSPKFTVETFTKNLHTHWWMGQHEKDKNGDIKGILLKK